MIDNLTINETIIFKGTIDEFKNKVINTVIEEFKFDWISRTEFRVTANYSLGVAVSDFGKSIFKGINLSGTINEQKTSNTLKIKLTTKLRPEIYFCIGLVFFFLIVLFFSKKEISYFTIFLISITPFWFGFVYRVQENQLIKKFKKIIKKIQ